MPRTCNTCKHSDASEINAMLIHGISFRNIVAKKDGGLSTAGLKRHKDKCLRELLGELMIERRAGLLADVDEVRSQIQRLEQRFAKNGPVLVALVSRRLDAIEKEAKLTGAYVQDKKNPPQEIDIAIEVFNRLVGERGYSEDDAWAFVSKQYKGVADTIKRGEMKLLSDS